MRVDSKEVLTHSSSLVPCYPSAFNVVCLRILSAIPLAPRCLPGRPPVYTWLHLIRRGYYVFRRSTNAVVLLDVQRGCLPLSSLCTLLLCWAKKVTRGFTCMLRARSAPATQLSRKEPKFSAAATGTVHTTPPHIVAARCVPLRPRHACRIFVNRPLHLASLQEASLTLGRCGVARENQKESRDHRRRR